MYLNSANFTTTDGPSTSASRSLLDATASFRACLPGDLYAELASAPSLTTIGSTAPSSCDSPLASTSPSGPVNWALWSGINHAAATADAESAQAAVTDEAVPIVEILSMETVMDSASALIPQEGLESSMQTFDVSAPEEAIPPSAAPAASAPSPAAARLSAAWSASADALAQQWARISASLSAASLAAAASLPAFNVARGPSLAAAAVVVAIAVLLARVVASRLSAPRPDLTVTGVAASLHPADEAPYLAGTPMQVTAYEGQMQVGSGGMVLPLCLDVLMY